MAAQGFQDEMYTFIKTILTEIGARESCSENERRLGRRLAQLWTDLGHEVHTETFTCHPKAFLGFVPFSALLYLAATIFYWVYAPLCVVLAGAAVALIVFELLRYREFVDPLFPAAEGENVIAIVRPRGEVRRRVVVSAHQDSAYEVNLWFFLQNAAVPIMVIGFAAAFVPLLGGLAKTLAGAAATSRVFDDIGYVAVALYPFVGLNLLFHSYAVVPGAMDDLAGVSVLTGLGRVLANGEASLEHTEVRLLATSSEEAGLRGAKRYVSAHGSELHEIPTYGLFVDGVYDERFLTVFSRELFTGARHHPGLVQMAQEVSAAHGWPIRTHVLPLGSTDASAFSLAGVPSVCLLCQDTTRLVPNYHTRRDTIEHIRPESLSVMLQLVLDMIQRIDAGDVPHSESGGDEPAVLGERQAQIQLEGRPFSA